MPLIDIKKLRTDGGTQHGGRGNDETIAEYTEAYLEGKKMPPVQAVFDGTHYWLWDGFSRVAAAREAGQKGISVEVTRGTVEDAFDLSLGANLEHGLRRKPENKKAIVLAALACDRHALKHDREIARLCGVSHSFVAGLRSPDSVIVKARVAAKAAKESTAAVTDGKSNPSVTKAGDAKDDPTAPGDVKVTKPKVTPIAQAAVVAERDELKGKVIEIGGELERAMAEIRVLEAAVDLGDPERALREENATLRKRIGELEEANFGLTERAKELSRLAAGWQRKAKAAR